MDEHPIAVQGGDGLRREHHHVAQGLFQGKPQAVPHPDAAIRGSGLAKIMISRDEVDALVRILCYLCHERDVLDGAA